MHASLSVYALILQFKSLSLPYTHEQFWSLMHDEQHDKTTDESKITYIATDL